MKKRALSLMLAAAMCMGTLGGATMVHAEESGEPVNLIHYLPWLGATEDLPKINEELNRLLKEKIGVTVDLKAIDMGQFGEKMNMVNNGGEYYDLTFTSNWLNDYYTNIANDGFLAIDDLVAEYGKEMTAEIPQKFMDALKVDGKLYSVPNYQIAVATYGYWWNLDFMKMVEEATGFEFNVEDYSTFDLESLEPVLEAAAEANIPGSIPFVTCPSAFYGNPILYGYDSVSSGATPGWVKLDDEAATVVNQYAEPAFRDYAKLMKKWMDAGYIRPDAAMISNTGDAGKGYEYIGAQVVFVKPGDEETYRAATGYDLDLVPVTEPVCNTGRAAATMTAISSKTEHPVEAMKYLNLMATDPEVYNIIAYGLYDNAEKGSYFVKDGENTVAYAEGVNAETNPYTQCLGGWIYGNQFLQYLKPGDPSDVWEVTKQWNEEAVASPLLGFNYNPEAVKTQVAACQAVLDEYLPALETGSVDDVDATLDDMLEKLETAGVNELIAGLQEQVDAWAATK